VEDIAWRNTTVRALGNHIIIVPNSVMSGSIVKNFILPDSQNSILIPVGVSYASDLKKVEKITIEVATEIQKRVEGAVEDHIPLIRFNEFADSSINFNVILRSGDFTSQFLIKHEFIKALHERYNKEGIDIPFPIRTVYLKKEE
jgi:small-conductance mechanosensitive channel